MALAIFDEAARPGIVRALVEQRQPCRAIDVAARTRRVRLGVEETSLGGRSATIAQRQHGDAPHDAALIDRDDIAQAHQLAGLHHDYPPDRHEPPPAPLPPPPPP